MSKNVGLLRIFPSISASVIRAFCQAPIEGVVLESYGAGNIPSNRKDVLEEIKEAVNRGVIVVNITQCNTGAVSSLYETGRDHTLIDAIASSLNITCPRKLVEVTEKVFSALLFYAIDHNDFRGVKKILGE
ncbi:L-asparaginase [Papilio xuthus]|uniref:asparaginase n=1 Tax=Papilio xuthus TaxID=66420 RepID=A0A0N1PHA9_PAPXU|nr:L-asparaginase [Papilio xuthus]